MELELIKNSILEIRGKRVILDYELAKLYEVETKALKQAVRRNIDRFPEDFMFQLTKEEWKLLRSQSVTLEIGKGHYPKYLPFAFTEQGVAMLSAVLNSQRAIHASIQIMRAFDSRREALEPHQHVADAFDGNVRHRVATGHIGSAFLGHLVANFELDADLRPVLVVVGLPEVGSREWHLFSLVLEAAQKYPRRVSQDGLVGNVQESRNLFGKAAANSRIVKRLIAIEQFH
jgi:hypothetical protein